MIATRVAKNAEELKKYDVAVKDNDGNLRATYDILVDLAPKWEQMSNAEQVALGNTLAGTNQYKIFAAIMNQMSVAQESYRQALESSGTTMKQNEVYMNSLEAKTTALKAEFEKLVLGDGGLQDLAKFFIDLGTGTLKLVNTLGGLKSVLTVLAGVILTVKADTLVKNFNKLTTSITTLIPRLVTAIGYFREGRASGLAFGDALKAAGIKASVAQVAIGALTTVISIAVIAWGAYQASVEKANAVLEQSRQEYEQYINTLEGSVSKIQNENTSKKELIQINKDLKGSYEDEKQALIDVNDLRKENLELLYQENQQKANEYITEHANEARVAQEFLNGTVKDSGILFKQLAGILTTQTLTHGEMAISLGKVRSELSNIINLSPDKAAEELQAKINELTTEIDKNGSATEEQKLQLEEYTEAYTTINSKIDESTTVLEAYNTAKAVATQTEEEFIKARESGIEFDELTLEELDALIEKYGITEDEIQALIESEDGLNYTRSDAIQLLAAEKEASQNYQQTAEELEKTLNTLAQTLGITVTELDALKEKFDDVTLITFLTNLAKIKQQLDDTSTVIDNLQEAMTTAQAALDEYTASGSLTVDTFQSLMSISAQYLTALVNENGQLTINQNTLGNLIQQLKVAKIEELQMAEATDIAAYAQGDLDKMSALARNSLINVGNAAITAGKNAESSAKGWWTLAEAIASAKTIAGDNTDIASDINIQRIHNSYRKLANQISEIKVNTTAAGQATSKAGKAAKSAGKAAKSAGKAAEEAAKKAKKAIEDEIKALEKKQKQYERVIKWIEKQYDKEIDKIKKEKDEALDAIEAQIKAREKEKDKILDAIEAEIKALKDQKDARKKYWDDQIDALKKANQAKKDSLELQEKLDALEKARNTKVKIYKEGQGFVYDVDQTEVAKAKKALDEYLSEKAYEDELARLEALRDAELDNFEQRIDALEDYKDKVEENLEAQIESLKAYKEQVEAQYDAQIKIYEDAKQQFEDMVNAYEEEQDRLLALELAGINAENNNWMLRLENLQNFVSEYHSLLKQVEDAKERLDALNNQETTSTASTASSSGSGSVSSSGGGTKKASSGGSKTYTTHADILPTVTKQSVTATKTLGSSTAKKTIADGAKSSFNPYASLFKHANGIDTIPNDEIAIVGESPNQEMVIGSKLNGKLMSLDKGTGVVNAESSKSLAGMLNQVGKFGASGFGSGGGTLNTNYNNDSLTINGVTIQGANIKDPETFVNGLLNLKAEALQRAYKHK